MDLRRSPRVLAQIPIMISGDGPVCRAVTAVVNREGALILSPTCYRLDTVIHVENLNTHQTAVFRVVWEGQQEADGQTKLGIEFIEQRPDFWGVTLSAAPVAPPRPARP